MVDTDLIKKLRAKTKAGVMECKRALEDCRGDFDSATALLKEQGLAKAAKKAGREAKEGLIHAYIHNGGKVGSLVELNCETDFVARTDEFKALIHEIAMQVAAGGAKDTAELLAQPYIRDQGRTIKDLVDDTIAKLGENIKIGQFVRFGIK